MKKGREKKKKNTNHKINPVSISVCILPFSMFSDAVTGYKLHSVNTRIYKAKLKFAHLMDIN